MEGMVRKGSCVVIVGVDALDVNKACSMHKLSKVTGTPGVNVEGWVWLVIRSTVVSALETAAGMFEGNGQVEQSRVGLELSLGALEGEKGMGVVLKAVVRIHDVDGIVVQFAPFSHRNDVGRVGGAGDGIDFEAVPLRCLLELAKHEAASATNVRDNFIRDGKRISDRIGTWYRRLLS